jgi:hypothetical protein
MRIMRRQEKAMIHQAKTFNKIRHEWLGEGGEAVPIEQAQARADICTGRLSGKPCPNNYQGSWLYNVVTAIVINSQLELRRAMSINVEGEESLKVCEVCGCRLQLKVHVPFRHIYRHTTPEQLSKYPDFCWQQKELKQIT